MTFHIPKKALLLGSAKLKPQEVMATRTYTGNSSFQAVTNGLDLLGKGGLVWLKSRSNSSGHSLYDNVRGFGSFLSTESTGAEAASAANSNVYSFSNSGFNLGPSFNVNSNSSPDTFVSWSFRRAAKFFDIVTYTGNGVAGRQIPHSLGVVPGMKIIKCRSDIGNWHVAHRTQANPGFLNVTNAFNGSTGDLPVAMDATTFTVGGAGSGTNSAGRTYVAYLFAQNPDLIDCGSYVGNSSSTGPVVTCGSGWRPQWLMIKSATGASSWYIHDSARDTSDPRSVTLLANTSDAETNNVAQDVDFTTTGFQLKTTGGGINTAGNTFVYMTIREAY